ncbi:MAG: MqnA/MqnD/SBP family protein [Bacteroidota bacterium]|nr:MqnA/MqnD/SBP family protein [Bacteroidota bacterium]
MSSPIRTSPISVWRVGGLRDLYTQPLYRTIKGSASAELLFDTPSVHFDAIMSNELDAAFTTPVDYALNSSGMILYPNIGVSSTGYSNVARLYLRKNLQFITTMAVGIVSTTDVALTRIVLGEKYDSEPKIVPVLGSIDEMLAKADCALVTREILLTLQSEFPFIDVVDEWSDITELPFVHSFCIARSEKYSKEIQTILHSSMDAGRDSIGSIANEIAAETNRSADLIQNYLSHFSYGFDDLSKTSLEEFFRMAFYYGMLGDVPEIRVAD